MNTKQKMLDALDEWRRKVNTGEITGLILAAITKDDLFLSRTHGDPPGPHGVLVLEDIVNEAKRTFLERNNLPYDGAPGLGIADEPNSQETDET
jgi:hypothetical protein